MNIEKSNKSSNGPAVSPVQAIWITFLLWLICLGTVFALNRLSPSAFYPLTDQMTADVRYADGTTAHFEDGDFGTIHKMDQLKIHITLPEDTGINSPELFLPLYNSIVDVYLDGVPLFKDRYDPDHIVNHYGSRIYQVPLHANCGGKKLELSVTSVVSLQFSSFNGIGLVSPNEGWKRILGGQGLIFVISLSMMALSLFCVFYFSIKGIEEKRIPTGLPIAWFELLILAWFFGSMKLYHMIVSNTELCAKLEYYALYLAPLPLAVFIWLVIDQKLYKRITAAAIGVYVLFYIAATVVELSPLPGNYSSMMRSMHLTAGVLLIVLIVSLFAGIKNNKNSHLYILRGGVLISMICGVLELLRFNVLKYIFNKAWSSSFGFSTLAILIIAVSLVVYLISFSADEYTQRVEDNQLRFLAYRDSLTGLPNRNACYSSLDRMEAVGIRDYTMIFFDLNNLKLANDTRGHEEGDRLLKVTAALIADIFSTNEWEGFCGRWGGDEFVACVYGSPEKGQKKLEHFKQRMRAEDETKEFSFPYSVAYGYVKSTAEAPLAPLDAVRQADAFMYENKIRMKASRSQTERFV